MSKWFKPSERMPVLHRSVLVLTKGAGPVYDVACYAGEYEDGSRWIMADVRLDTRQIMAWQTLRKPPEWVRP